MVAGALHQAGPRGWPAAADGVTGVIQPSRRMMRQGDPAATTASGIVEVTTLPAPITLPAPMRAPRSIKVRAPMNASSPITTVSFGNASGGAAYRRGTLP